MFLISNRDALRQSEEERLSVNIICITDFITVRELWQKNKNKKNKRQVHITKQTQIMASHFAGFAAFVCIFLSHLFFIVKVQVVGN